MFPSLLKFFLQKKSPYYIVKGLTNIHSKKSFMYIVKNIENIDENTIKIKRKFIFENSFQIFKYNNIVFKEYSKSIKSFKELIKYVRMCKQHNKNNLFYIGDF